MNARALTALIRTPWRGRWRRFVDPIRTLEAARPEDVVACLAEVERESRARECFAAGFVTYEAAAAFGLPVREPSAEGLPLVAFGLFPADHVLACATIGEHGSHRLGAWQPSIDHDAYLEGIREIKRRIEAGDTYQINFTFRLTAPFEGDPLSLMADLDRAQAGAWSAFVDTGTHAICSASPELFFSLSDGRLECRPMKGTAARGRSSDDDRRQAERLRHSEKNRAENVMVVDMMRNDLGRVASVGSVSVSSLFDVERYPAQWQMTSTVSAQLSDSREPQLPRIFQALFPSGSVTGAPKRSSMGIIGALETTPRGIYTGAVGYLSPRGRAHFNVAIRTVAVDRTRGMAEFGVGSGVVWDSVDRDEYDECRLKASIVVPRDIATEDFRLLETIGWAADEGYVLLERHMDRLRESAAYFRFALDETAVRAALDSTRARMQGDLRVRVLLTRDGSIECQVVPRVEKPAPLRAALSPDPVDARDVFLYHKTTKRDVFERARASRPDADAVILWNEAGEVTEATDFNIVVEIDGRRITPPVECGLLPGTFRAELLARGEVVEERIAVDRLRLASRIWLINSVRRWTEATLMQP